MLAEAKGEGVERQKTQHTLFVETGEHLKNLQDFSGKGTLPAQPGIESETRRTQSPNWQMRLNTARMKKVN